MAEIANLNSAASLLQWDQETFMPTGAGDSRARQLATLYGLAHDQFTNTETHRLLEELKSSSYTLSNAETRSVERLWRDYQRKTCLDRDFVEKLSIQISRSFYAWEKARKEQNVALFSPELEQLIELKRQEADRIGYTASPYDALLEEYEPGMKTSELNRIFDVMLPELDKIYAKIPPRRDAYRHNEALFALSEEKQWKLCRDVLQMIGFDFTYGRLDKSTHPFTIGMHPNDVRITTRFNAEDLTVALWSTLHEAGHAFYEMGLNSETQGMPLSEAASLGIHESQSRLWENQVGRSIAFLKYIEPAFSKAFEEKLPKDFTQNLYQKINHIEKGLIRTEADELSYHYHIFIRYKIELEMIEGRLKIKDLRERWNTMYETYLGLKPNNDFDGVLQDVHWAHGSIGYFPTYTLGSIYAAQIFNAGSTEIQNLKHIHTGENLAQLKRWLNLNVFAFGRTFDANAICRKSTNNELNPLELIHYLEHKIATSRTST